MNRALILFFICFLTACKFSKEENKQVVTITAPNQVTTSFSLSQLGAKGLDYLVLNTGEDYLIGNVNKVISFQEYVLVLDEEYSESLFAFDKNGNLLFVVSAEQDGPDAIPEIGDFCVDTKREEILILSVSRKQIFRFSLQGELLSRFDIDAYFHFIAYHEAEDKIILARVEGEIPKDSYDNAQVIVLNDKGKVEAKFLPSTKDDGFLSYWFPLRALSEGNGRVYYAKNFKYDLWEINNEARITYRLDYGSRSIENLYPTFNQNPNNIRQELINKENYIRALPFFLPLPNDRWLHVLEGKSNQLIWHYFDINSVENHLFKFLVDDIENGLTGLPVGVSSDGFYYILTPEMLYATMQNNPEVLPNRLRDILTSIDYNGDYQVLVKVKF